MGYPILLFSLFLMTSVNLNGPVIPASIFYFFWNQVVLSIIFGQMVGHFARHLLKLAERKKWIDKESFFAFTVALAVNSLPSPLKLLIYLKTF